MLKLIEIELSRARNTAEHADDGFLLYLIDMAILEVRRKARAGGDDRDRSVVRSQYSGGGSGG